QSRGVRAHREGHGRGSDRERRSRWSQSAPYPCARVRENGRTRPCCRRITETALDTVRKHVCGKRASYSCPASARSNVRSASERSAFPKTRRLAHAQESFALTIYEPAEFLDRAEAAQCLPRGGRIRSRRMVPYAAYDAGLPVF